MMGLWTHSLKSWVLHQITEPNWHQHLPILNQNGSESIWSNFSHEYVDRPPYQLPTPSPPLMPTVTNWTVQRAGPAANDTDE